MNRLASVPLRGVLGACALSFLLAGCGELEWTRFQARMGDAEAEAELGRRYEEGDGVPRNPARAVAWYRRAIGNGMNIQVPERVLSRLLASAGVVQQHAVVGKRR